MRPGRCRRRGGRLGASAKARLGSSASLLAVRSLWLNLVHFMVAANISGIPIERTHSTRPATRPSRVAPVEVHCFYSALAALLLFFKRRGWF